MPATFLTLLTSVILQIALSEQQSEQKWATRAGKQQAGAATAASLLNHGLPLFCLCCMWDESLLSPFSWRIKSFRMVYLPIRHRTDKQSPEISPNQIISQMISQSRQQNQIQARHKKFSVQKSWCLALKSCSVMARGLEFHYSTWGKATSQPLLIPGDTTAMQT